MKIQSYRTTSVTFEPITESHTPATSWRVFIDENDRIRIDLDQDAKKYTRVVYCFTNHTNNKCLIGATEDFVSRMGGYEQEMTSDLESDIRNGDKVEVSILQVVDKNEDLDEIEDECIEFYDSIANGYNKRRGGGGGTTVERKSSETTPRTKKAIDNAIKELYTSPKKFATLFSSPTSKKVRIKASKEFKDKAKKSELYFMRHTGLNTMYVGESKNVQKRLNEHTFYTNNTKNPKYNKKINPVHIKSSRSPEKMVIKTIKTEKIKQRVLFETGNIPSRMELETGFIKYYDSYKNGDNRTSGGNGGDSKKKK